MSLLFSRSMTTGLVSLSAKPLAVHPSASSMLAISKLIKECEGQLRIYDVMHQSQLDSQRGVALSVVGDIAKARKAAISQMAPLPPVTAESFDEKSEVEAIESFDTTAFEPEHKPLPPDLQPQPMDNGLLAGDPEDAIQDFDTDSVIEELIELKQAPDFDPNIYPDMIEDSDPDSLKCHLDQFDAVDMKNCDNWNSDVDPEAKFFTREVHSWLKADMEECAKGARPKLYERLEVPNKTSRKLIISEDYDPSPLSASVPLSPYLLMYQVPLPRPLSTKYQDQEFRRIFERLVYLKSHEHFRRISCFKQDQPSIPQWLVIQEFTKIPTFSGWLTLKKREAEYWWRKNGWEGVLVEFFKLRQE